MKRKDLDELLTQKLEHLQEKMKQTRPTTEEKAVPRKLPMHAIQKPMRPKIETQFAYDESKQLEGIIAHLTHKYRGNVHDKDVVKVTAISFFGNDPSYHPKHAADLGSDLTYCSNGEEKAWLCYDFQNARVFPTSYTLRSSGDGLGGAHLKSWVFEVSNDGRFWTEVDKRENNRDLNGTYKIQNFKVARVLSQSFRYVRIQQTGTNHAGQSYLVVNSFEIFGNLYTE